MQEPQYGDTSHTTGNRYVLAIDLGSGGYKVAIVSDTGDVVASADASIETQMLPNGGAEQDPAEWWNKVIRLSKQVIASSGISPGRIVGVGCDSQWSVAVPVDEKAHPLMNAVHWLDTRGGRYNRAITAGFPSIQGYGLLKLLKWVRLTGMAPTHSGVDSLGHVLYIKNERPDVYEKTYKFLEPMDYLTARFTGRITATQKTMAPFVIVDNREWGSLKYNEELMKLAGVEKEKFPELISNNGIVGTLKEDVAEGLGLHPSTPVITGVGDSNASLIGSGAVLDFDPIIYIGTSLYMTCHIPFKKTDLTHVMTSLPSPFESRYYLLGEQGTGGRCVEFYLNQMIYADDAFKTGTTPEDMYECFNAMANQAPAGSDGVIFLPWLNGSIVPSEDPYVRAGFMNLSLKTNRSHLSRAIMEGLAYNNRWTRRAAEKFLGRKIEGFRFAGGGALSDGWAQIHADVLGVDIYQVDDPVNTTVRGTGLLAFAALGCLSLEKIPGLVKIKKVFTPNPDHRDIYDRMYTQYREIFKRNKKVYRALNRDA